MSRIVSLPKLESLIIEDLENITDDIFDAMPNLRDLDCSYCPKLRNAGLARLVRNSDRIEHIYMSNCDGITNDFLHAAIKATKKRKSNVVLKLHASYTDVKYDEARDSSPFLLVIPIIVISFAEMDGQMVMEF